jgi:hypothetical protein
MERASPTAVYGNRSDMPDVVVSMSKARRLAAGLSFSLRYLPSGVLDLWRC